MRRARERIIFVLSCTQRKRESAPAELQLRSVTTRPEERPHTWIKRLAEVHAISAKARETYAGDHWRAACEAHRLGLKYSSRSELWVLSAGYGLISSESLIKAYSATF